MNPNFPTVVVAGHLCVDLVPRFGAGIDPKQVFVPGTLTEVGLMHLCTGGSVSNTGLGLHRLGVPVRMVGKIGPDFIGRLVAELYCEAGPGLDRYLVSDPSALSSYTMVFNPPGVDRCFLHCPGANATFGASDVSDTVFDGASWLHFGYPPLMERIGLNDGRELKDIFDRAHNAGLGTSLDMAYPDPSGATARVDWMRYMENVLPSVDVFVPSIDEILIMLGEPVDAANDPTTVRRVADALLNLGVKVVLLKLGTNGLFLRTGNGRPLENACARFGADPEVWSDLSLYRPCFQVDVDTTSGSGDTTIAGFLAGILSGQGPEDAAQSAVATGAFSVEGPDATSTIPKWAAVQRRIEDGWPSKPPFMENR